jgi:hypothetical protein
VAEIKVPKNRTFLELRNIGEIMKEVKTQRSRSYREYLISSLKDPERLLLISGLCLELDEEGFEPELLRSALKEVWRRVSR